MILNKFLLEIHLFKKKIIRQIILTHLSLTRAGKSLTV